MALEGCTECIHALADKLLNASHAEVREGFQTLWYPFVAVVRSICDVSHKT